MGYRRFRIECLNPLLVVPKLEKTKKKKIPSQNGGRPHMPRGRLARAVKDLLEAEEVILKKDEGWQENWLSSLEHA